MTKEEVVRRWLEHVHEDICTAEDLVKTGHYLYVGFLCHQALEKVLKAYYSANNDDDPPYTHSHMKLIDVCGLTDEFTAEHLRFIDLILCISRLVILNRRILLQKCSARMPVFTSLTRQRS